MCIYNNCQKPNVHHTTLCEDHIGKTVVPMTNANTKEQQTSEATE